jgi:hypothetical protein
MAEAGAFLRGWFPGWMAQLRAWSASDWILWAALLVATAATLWAIFRSR